MDNIDENKFLVAVIGAGPAGIYASKQLAGFGARVALFNRDVKAGGLAEYGIYPDKHKMKDGLRHQFRQILGLPLVEYYGNVSVGESADITLAQLREMGFQAFLITVGAQGTKWLGLPGENLIGVYHAKDCVYHYNRLPPFSTRPFHIGKRVAIVGAGNVMMDISHWLVRELKVNEIIAVVRRGPAEVKFDKREFQVVAANVDLAALDVEIERVRPIMESIGQDPAQAKASILAGLARAEPPNSHSCFRFEFLASPTRIVGDRGGCVTGLEVEENTLVRTNGDTKAKSLGTRHIIDVDTVIFAIGDRVEDGFGLPVSGYAFAKNPIPRFPVDGISYEAFDPKSNLAIDGVFLAGWARLASVGLVGVARQDGERGAKAVIQFLQTMGPTGGSTIRLNAYLKEIGKPFVSKTDLSRLEQIERGIAAERGLVEFKFATNEEMLEALSLARA